MVFVFPFRVFIIIEVFYPHKPIFVIGFPPVELQIINPKSSNDDPLIEALLDSMVLRSSIQQL
jgi:hypothetical protein